MSQSQVKRYKRIVLKNRDEIIKNFVRHAKKSPFWERVRFAWAIIRAK